MTEKIILVADPGIDGAFAVALALHDPTLEVLGLAATAGNVSAEQATTTSDAKARIRPTSSRRVCAGGAS